MMETSVASGHVTSQSVPARLALILALGRGHLFVWLPVFLGAGGGLYFTLTVEPPITLYFYLLAACAALPLALRRWPAVMPLAWALAMTGAGFAAAGLHAHNAAAPVLKFRYYGPIEGKVVAIDRSASGKPRLTLDQVRLDRVAPHKRPHRVRVSLHGDQSFIDPKPGMTVMMTGHLSPPAGPVEPGGFDFQRKAWFDRLGAVGYTRTPALVLYPPEINSLSLRIFQIRRTISEAIKTRLPDREGAFAAAILTGDRADIDEDALKALRASNLAHLLAISGLHMGLLTGVIFTLIRVILALMPPLAMRTSPKKVAAVAAFVTAIAYLAISGASVATQRAFIMAAVMLAAICLDRRALTLRAVAVAALIVLLLSPEALPGPGFQMSFAATTALVATFAHIRDKQLFYRFPKWTRGVLSLIISSGIAGLATAPFGALHFNQVAHYGLLANLLSVPVMGFVVMPGAVLAAVLTPLGLEQLGLEIMRLGLAWILQVAETIASWDSSLRRIPTPTPIVLPLLGIGGALLCLISNRFRLSGIVVLIIAFTLWSASPRPELLLSDTGTLFGVLTPEGRVLNRDKGDGFVAKVWLENDGDTTDQPLAAMRGTYARKQATIPLGEHVIAYDANKELSADHLADLCRSADLVITPMIKTTLPCDGINATRLRREGSFAIFPSDHGLSLTSGRDTRGDRLWVR